MYESLYAILGVPEDSSGDEIKRAYRIAAQKYHPDKLDTSASDQARSDAQDRFNKIHLAYEVLSSPAKRKDYDLTLSKKREQYLIDRKLEDIAALIGGGKKVSAISAICDLLDKHPRIPDASDLKEHCGLLAYNHA
jgi:DnaJ-class molecular chaperone